MTTLKSESVWIIAGDFGAYTGWWQTKKEAIAAHTKSTGKSWRYCRRKRDRAIKAKLNFYYPSELL